MAELLELWQLVASDQKTSYESNSDTNAFTDTLLTKLTNIETLATADLTGAEIKSLLFALADTNNMTDALRDKLNAIEDNATADLTGPQIKSLLFAVADTNNFTDSFSSKLVGIDSIASLKSTLNATTAPGVTDDSASDYGVGSVWIDVTGDDVYQAVDVTVGAAVWKDLSAAGGGGGSMNDLSDDLTPQLGGFLDVNGEELRSIGGTDITLHSDNDVNVVLGDAAGVDDFNIKDSGNVSVFGVTSDGVVTLAGTLDGRDVATDGTKLDGIDTAAKDDQSAAEILTAIKTVDGAASGLDADLLDGSEATAFATAAQGTLADNALPKGGGAMTGAITTNSTFDGIDVGVDVAANTAKVTNATHTGDVAGATTLTIQPDAVTLDMMADIATDTFLGRDTTATGTVEVMSVATAKTLLAMALADISDAGSIASKDFSVQTQATYDGLTPDANTLYFNTTQENINASNHNPVHSA